MKHTRKVLGLGLVAGVGAGLALALHRATHPVEARRLGSDVDRRRPPVPDSLFDMPDGVTYGDLTTPDGGTIHYAEKGAGRPLVLFHGVTLRHDVWAPQFHQLADRYRVIAVDLRGHGWSRPGRNGFGMACLADDVATVLESLDLHGAILAGHSMGGMTVMHFCGDHREVLDERVAGVALVATSSHQTVPPYLLSLARNALTEAQARLTSGGALPGRHLVSRRAVRLVFGAAPSPKAVDLVTEMTRSIPDEHLLGSLGGVVDHDAREALRSTRTPSLVVVGSRDILTPPTAARALARLLPGCDFVLLPRAGHQLMQERPEELAELLDALVERVTGEADSVAEVVADDPDSAIDATDVEPSTDSV